MNSSEAIALSGEGADGDGEGDGDGDSGTTTDDGAGTTGAGVADVTASPIGAVLGLLGENPFPGEPPRFVRARVAPYRFASAEERRTGVWWVSGEARLFMPVEER